MLDIFWKLIIWVEKRHKNMFNFPSFVHLHTHRHKSSMGWNRTCVYRLGYPYTNMLKEGASQNSFIPTTKWPRKRTALNFVHVSGWFLFQAGIAQDTNSVPSWGRPSLNCPLHMYSYVAASDILKAMQNRALPTCPCLFLQPPPATRMAGVAALLRLKAKNLFLYAFGM